MRSVIDTMMTWIYATLLIKLTQKPKKPDRIYFQIMTSSIKQSIINIVVIPVIGIVIIIA